ncbi:MAG: hypothetical protein E7588_05870 [Ruminococcaceae bacterium]|nr:hypothetical protein [Oscillospiraceae bacterium]
MKKTKFAFFHSLIALLLCFSMLLGSTFAWFTESVSTDRNIITSGNIDLEMYWSDDPVNGPWYNIEDDAYNTIFSYDNWEPGYSQIKYIKLVNKGDLALNYKFTLMPEGAVGKLAEVIAVRFAKSAQKIETREQFENLNFIGFLNNVMNGGSTASGTILPAGSTSLTTPVGEIIMTLGLQMIPTAGNAYQNQSIGSGFSITAIASQSSYEEDSFGIDYDLGDTFDELIRPASGSVTVVPDNGKVPSGGAVIDAGTASATIPEGVVMADNQDTLSLTVTPLENTTTDITVVNSEILIPVDVHVEGVSDTNDVPIIVDLGPVMPKNLNIGNYTLIHVEDGVNNIMTAVADASQLTAHNTFIYDPLTGNISVALATFSEVAIIADIENEWQGTIANAFSGGTGTEDDPYIIANADQLAYMGELISNENETYGKAHYKLVADINFGGEDNANIFYPIGYHKEGGEIAPLGLDDAPEAIYEINEDTKASGAAIINEGEAAEKWYTYGGAFSGTFDGNGHTISDIYQNTWVMKGNYDGNYWNAAMGIFGYVYDGTIKNLTVDNFESDGEFTPTGVIAAYAAGDSTFENIAITNCNPRVYNTGNGGIIGIAGNTSAANDDHITLKNITVDNSNKISALWGSWDVACGGLVGMYRGNVDGSGNATDDTISFENCHVSAIIDVYNDVCANYQYYAYRYSGMIIGSVRHNTTNDDGKVIPNMTGISATGCTVNYGDWNDYYYCEFEKNTMASYSEDYQFSRVPHSELNFTDYNVNGVVDADERASVTGCKHTHTAEENHQAIYLPFHQLFTGYSWGVSSIGLEKYSGIVTDLGITEGDQEKSDVKFETKFTGDFLYRVGNGNTVSVGSLFAAMDGAKINNSGVWVTVDKVDENSNVSGTFTANTTDWTEGTIQFSGTGVVKVTIQDYDFCTPTTITLEVVDAVNATSATNATKNNVVLLNDCGFSSLEVSGGYTLFGNGFTMTCGSDSAALDMGYSFVTLNNGTLDNVQIVCPNFDYAVLYKSNMTESGNRSETTDRTRYYNVKSGVMASGNSQILNSRISGARAAVNVSGGNVVIDNSRIELGAVASILVGSANSLTLRDVTLVQKPTASTYDSSKTLMGFSVLSICDANGDAASITLEGTLVQNAWIDENDKQYVPSAGQSIISTVMAKTEYLHDIDGNGTNESLNLGIAYMPESLTSKVNTTTITDNRTNKDAVPYDYAEVSILNGKTYVYSYKNTNGTADSFKTESEYTPDKYSDLITVTYSDTADGLTTGKSFGTDGWVYELNVDLDKLSGYALDFSKLSMSVNGTTVTDFKVNGNTKPTSPVAVTAGGTTYALTATINGKEYTATYKVTGTETSKESPSLVASNYEAGLCVASSYGGTWHGAAPALEGIQIKYWSVAEKQYKTINLSDYTPTTAGKQNGTNTTWTYSPDNGDFTLTLTGGQVHSGNSVNAMPVVCNEKLYFVAASSKGLVNSGNSARTIPVSYSFKDNNNGVELKFSHTWSVEENKDAQYNYSDFCNGTMTKLEAGSSGGNCVTPDTLITLADGSQKRVDCLTGNEELLVWNLETGKYDKAPIVFIDSESESEYEIIHLYFSDGSDVKVIYEHGFFDLDLGKYVYIDASNYIDYIGHSFVTEGNIASDEWNTATLDSVVIEKELTTAWSPVTFGHLCYYTEGVLSMPGGISGLFNIFDVDTSSMIYDADKMHKDIETYGLFTLEDFGGIITKDAFDAFNGDLLKIAIGKGLLTMEDIACMAERYIPLM